MYMFKYGAAKLHRNERIVARQCNVKLFDGDRRTRHQDGELILTTDRLLWARHGDLDRGGFALMLKLRHVARVDEEITSFYIFGHKRRIILYLQQNSKDSPDSFIKLSAKRGMSLSFRQFLNQTLRERHWEHTTSTAITSSNDTRMESAVASEVPAEFCENLEVDLAYCRSIVYKIIADVESALENPRAEKEQEIALAMHEFGGLLGVAAEMAYTSNNSPKGTTMMTLQNDVAIKFQDLCVKMGCTQDMRAETEFPLKSVWHKYFLELSKELASQLKEPLMQNGGSLSLHDAYNIFNRTREDADGDLIPPQDLIRACKFLKGNIRISQSAKGIMELKWFDDKRGEVLAT